MIIAVLTGIKISSRLVTLFNRFKNTWFIWGWFYFFGYCRWCDRSYSCQLWYRYSFRWYPLRRCAFSLCVFNGRSFFAPVNLNLLSTHPFGVVSMPRRILYYPDAYFREYNDKFSFKLVHSNELEIVWTSIPAFLVSWEFSFYKWIGHHHRILLFISIE